MHKLLLGHKIFRILPIWCRGDGIYLVGYFVRGEFDVVHEGLLGFVAADVHHLFNGVFVGEVHIGDTICEGCYRLSAWGGRLEASFPWLGWVSGGKVTLYVRGGVDHAFLLILVNTDVLLDKKRTILSSTVDLLDKIDYFCSLILLQNEKYNPQSTG